MRQVVAGFLRVGAVLCEIDEVSDGFERVVDLVSDGGRESADGGELFAFAEGGFEFDAGGDVALDANEVGELAGAVADRGKG